VNYTPGPWSIAGRGYTIFGSDDAVVISSFDAETDEEEERYIANARLIAAAPDLLAALEGVIEDSMALARGYAAATGDRLTDEGEGIRRARAAIAKARGES
jgi:hypothetical protein